MTLPAANRIENILVVCSGNICRSPMAAAQLRAALFEADIQGIRVHSAGTIAMAGGQASPDAIQAADTHGLDITHHRSTPLTVELIEKADVILVMEAAHLQWIMSKLPRASKKTYLLGQFAEGSEKGRDVPDPIGTTAMFYERTFVNMQKMIRRFVQELGGKSKKS